jgi:DNA-binding MarR family transcriptional regulator
MSKQHSPPADTVPFPTTLRVRDRCFCLHAQRAARALARRFDLALKPVGLTNGQFSLLMALNRPEPPNMASVAALLAMDRTTLTALLKPLVRRGLVEALVDGTDRRNRRLVLTTAGQTALAAAMPIWTRENRRLEALFADPTRLRDDLNRLA